MADFINLGKYIININHICYIQESGDSVTVCIDRGSDKPMYLPLKNNSEDAENLLEMIKQRFE